MFKEERWLLTNPTASLNPLFWHPILVPHDGVIGTGFSFFQGLNSPLQALKQPLFQLSFSFSLYVCPPSSSVSSTKEQRVQVSLGAKFSLGTLLPLSGSIRVSFVWRFRLVRGSHLTGQAYGG
jgi:hypothetical protein